MKTIIFCIAILACGNTWSQSLQDTSREINAQTTIVRAGIDNVMKKLDRKQTDMKFRADDYWKMQSAFRTKVDYKLRDFEEVVTKDILSKARFLIDQYNYIYHSTDFSRDQKEIMLQERFGLLRNEFSEISKQYKQEIEKVYEVLPELGVSYMLIDLSRKWSCPHEVRAVINNKVLDEKIYWDSCYRRFHETRGDLNRNNNSVGEMDAFFPGVNYPVLDKVVYKTHVYNILKSECKSRICISLNSGDMVTTITLIQNSIDRDLVFTLSDGKRVTLERLKKDSGMLLKFLKFTDYPEELPFEAAN